MLRIIALLPRPVHRWMESAQLRFSWLRSLRIWMAKSVKNRDGVILSGIGKGLRFNPGTSNASYLLGTAEPAIQEALLALLTPGMVFYDIGANVGFLSVLASHLVGPTGFVVAFEPVESNVRSIEHNVRLNDAAITVLPIALCDEDGWREFEVSGSTVGRLASSQTSGSRSSKTQTVPTRRLDSIRTELTHPSPDVIKIDVEGAEVMVLRGGKTTIARCRPVIMIELHGTNAGVQVELDALGYRSFILGSALAITEAPPFAYVIAAPQESPGQIEAVRRVCETARDNR